MDEILDEKTYETRNVQYASFSQRSAASLMDVFLFVIISFGLYYVFGLAATYMLFLQTFWWKILPIVLLYYVYFEGSENNATLGKQIMNIRLLNEEKRDIDFTDSAKHLLFSVILFFGYFILLTNEKRQTLADKFCKVIVVKV